MSFACSADNASSVSISVALTDHSCSLWIFTGTESVLDDEGCGVGNFQPFKDMGTGMIIGTQQTDWRKGAEVGTDGQWSMMVSFAAMNSELIDPLSAPPPGPEPGLEAEPEPEPEAEPESDQQEALIPPPPPAEASPTSRQRSLPEPEPEREPEPDNVMLSIPDVDDMATAPPSSRREPASATSAPSPAPAPTVEPAAELTQAQAELADVQAAKGSLEEKLQSAEGELMRERLRADMAEQELDEERSRANAVTRELESERRLRERAEEVGAGLKKQVSLLENAASSGAAAAARVPQLQAPLHVAQHQQVAVPAAAGEQRTGFVPVQTVQLMTAAMSANAIAMESLASNLQGYQPPSAQQP